MLTRRIIPCLDILKGRVVKGTNFLGLRDAGDPVEVAQRYEQEQADELVFLDITASHEERPIILDVVRRTAERCFMPLTVGGGIRTLEDIRDILKAGADAALAAGIFHYRRHTIAETKAYLAEHGVPVRSPVAA